MSVLTGPSRSDVERWQGAGRYLSEVRRNLALPQTPELAPFMYAEACLGVDFKRVLRGSGGSGLAYDWAAGRWFIYVGETLTRPERHEAIARALATHLLTRDGQDGDNFSQLRDTLALRMVVRPNDIALAVLCGVQAAAQSCNRRAETLASGMRLEAETLPNARRRAMIAKLGRPSLVLVHGRTEPAAIDVPTLPADFVDALTLPPANATTPPARRTRKGS